MDVRAGQPNFRQRFKRKASPDNANNADNASRPNNCKLSLNITDLIMALSLVIGGCCVNVWSFEAMLRTSSCLGSAMTFGQMAFITCQALPHFILWEKRSALLPFRFLPRQVPLREWGLQVLVLTTGSLLNNWAFAYNVPLTLQIVFRSSGLPVSMLLGYIFLKRRYSARQIMSVVLVTTGVVLATTSRPLASTSNGVDDYRKYLIGVSMLSISLLLTGILGVLQERTYEKYGPCWREGIFYTHLLSLPVFIFLIGDIRDGFRVLKTSPELVRGVPRTYLVFGVNLLTQLLCVSGVNQVASRVSSVSTNIVLTARKAISLCLSVWLFRSGWNVELVVGAVMVFSGSLMYVMAAPRR
ncbi:UAA transporter [Phellopilus nigrolimitatus]|nr:UAA transporter [Phellopilus nigrolimitatus]